MANLNGKIASTRWDVKGFCSQWSNNKNKDIIGGYFSFGSSRFLLFYNPVDLWENDKFGILLDQLIGKRPLKVNFKLWFENNERQKFQEYSVQNHTFSKEKDRCEFKLKLSDVDHIPLSNVFENWGSLYICCEISDLNYQATNIPITDCAQKFHQDMQSMYEQKQHDAVIKIGKTEFKILKSQFMAHSEVFKQMFTLDFKERKTSTIEIKDISEQTMEQLIKWLYACQIDDKSAIENLYEAADKYQINLLKTRCAELMVNSLNNINVFRRLILAVIYNDKQLKDFSLAYISRMSGIKVATYFISSEWIEFGQKKSAVADEVKKAIVEKLDK